MKRLLLVTAMTFVLAGCAEESQQARPVVPDLPVDRDQDAVRAALNQLDPCALLDVVVRGVVLPADAERTKSAAHDCAYRVPAEQSDVAGVHVTESFGQDLRYRAADYPVAGWRAYRHRDAYGACLVTFPVSFTSGVTVSFGTRLCGEDRTVAEAAAEALADPDSLAGNSAARWTGCTLLGAALDREPGELIPDGSDSCADDAGHRVVLRDDPDHPGGSEPLNGRLVEVEQLGDVTCLVSWPPGGPGTDDVVEAYAPDCAAAREFAGGIIDVYDEPPVQGSPQRPLLYRVDEPDVPAVGACAHLSGDTTTCVPVENVEAPDDLLAAGPESAPAACAAATEAVREAFGEEMRPVAVRGTDTDRCVFVEPSHEVELDFVVRDSPLDDAFVSGPRSTSVAGHPALSGGQVAGNLATHELAVSTGSAAGEGGHLRFVARFQPERGSIEEAGTLNRAPSVDEAMESLVRRYFG